MRRLLVVIAASGIALIIHHSNLAHCQPADLPVDDTTPIVRAVEKGVRFLKSAQLPNGSWTYDTTQLSQFDVGITSLVGLTLWECGLAANDPVIAKAGEFVRN